MHRNNRNCHRYFRTTNSTLSEEQLYKTMKGGTNMAAVKEEKNKQTEDVREYIELLKSLTETERAEVKGYMTCMQANRRQLAVKTA